MSKQSSMFSFLTKSPQVQNQKTPATSKIQTLKIHGKEIKLLDIVWAKLEGYPWWPSLVCESPGDKSFIRKKKIHVQFFENPPSRGWVKDSFIKPWGRPSSLGIAKCKDKAWQEAIGKAEAALALDHDKRSDLIVCSTLSDEDEDMEDTDYDDSDKSKENVDLNGSVGSDKSSKKRRSLTPNAPFPKKRRIILSDSDSEDEYKPVADASESESASSGVDENEVSDIEMNSVDEESPVKLPKTKSTVNTFKKNITFSPSVKSVDLNSSTVSDTTKSKLSSFAAKDTPTKSKSDEFPHTKLNWLKPEKIKDKEGRLKSHPEYNPKTLYVPEDFLNRQTPAMRQWWILKSDYFDTVLFFKMGKFYELFHMDAVLSIEELGLLMMRGENAHTGFPEISYGRYSSILIERGYKVARIEQTETPDMMEKRCKTSGRVTKFDKVVKREICQVSSLGTMLPSVINGQSSTVESSYLLSITERSQQGPGELRKFGISFIDTTMGTFYVGQFEDDRHISRLRTLVAHYPPAQIILDRGHLSSKTLQLVKATVPANLQESLLHETEYWSGSKTLQILADGKYFQRDSKVDWPEVFKTLCSEGDMLGLTPSEDYELGVSALGGLLFYLKFCLMEEDLLTRRSFEIYQPPDRVTEVQQTWHRNMIVDGTTLQNLEIFQNSSDGGTEGTLFEKLNSCCTPFGKRLLHCWICSPLCNQSAINDRLNAIEDLKNNASLFDKLQNLFKSLPDLEKLLSKIHSQGLKRKTSHPDGRAIFFEDKTYSKRKVLDFLTAVQGFKKVNLIPGLFEGCEVISSILKSCSKLTTDNGKFPDLSKILDFFENAFDHDLAKKEGKIIPSAGVDEEYDAAIAKIKDIQKQLDNYLKEQCSYFSAKVNYFGSDKKRFQLEVADRFAVEATEDYELVSQRKGFKRFWTKETKEFLANMMAAELEKENALKDVARRIFQQFDDHSKEWTTVVECTSVIDVLMALTTYALQNECCRPIIEVSNKPFIEIEDGRHPCTIKTFGGSDFIPNDVIMGSDKSGSHAQCVLVTGPNMGGKSTLMRQTALICLLSQMGSYVPASSCRMSPVDRIFTRLGAWDRIYRGESTFYVEMAETAAIIQHATANSLVIVDELGRGTATYDGTAIASSVVDKLRKIGCRTLFATHYHSLVEEFSNTEGISLGNMACMVENADVEDSCQENIVFLYKFTEGSCPKSYGFNVARLANIPENVIKIASQKAKQLEQKMLKKKLFGSVFKLSDYECVENLSCQLKRCL